MRLAFAAGAAHSLCFDGVMFEPAKIVLSRPAIRTRARWQLSWNPARQIFVQPLRRHVAGNDARQTLVKDIDSYSGPSDACWDRNLPVLHRPHRESVRSLSR